MYLIVLKVQASCTRKNIPDLSSLFSETQATLSDTCFCKLVFFVTFRDSTSANLLPYYFIGEVFVRKNVFPVLVELISQLILRKVLHYASTTRDTYLLL